MLAGPLGSWQAGYPPVSIQGLGAAVAAPPGATAGLGLVCGPGSRYRRLV